MTKPALATLLIVLISAPLFTQNPFIKQSVYFKTDSFSITAEHRILLDALISDLQGKEVIKVIIRGNTDADADSVYNMRLSDKRTAAVAEYLSGSGLDRKYFVTDHYGENKPRASNDNEAGKQINRRVDIIVTYKIPMPSTQVVEIMDSIPAATASNCSNDTLIILPGGSQVKMNACEYREKKDCLRFTEFITNESIRAAGLTTYDDNGNALQSGGMIRFETCDSVCLDKPALIRLPVPCNFQMNMQLYTLNGDSTWSDPQNKIRVVSQGGNLYYEFPVECPYRMNNNSASRNKSGMRNSITKNVDKPVDYSKRKINTAITFNCDRVASRGGGKLLNIRVFVPKTRFKAEKGLTFRSVSMATSCPIGQYNARINKKGTKAVFTRLGCLPQSAEVRVVASTTTDTLITGYKSLRLYHYVKTARRCKTNPKKVFVKKDDFMLSSPAENSRM